MPYPVSARVAVDLGGTRSKAACAYGSDKELLFSAELGCDKCHNGPHSTNNKTLDVGTGQPFQVPTLIGVAARAPYLHDGCVATLADCFDPALASCNGGANHGHADQLGASDVSDLIAYLETL